MQRLNKLVRGTDKKEDKRRQGVASQQPYVIDETERIANDINSGYSDDDEEKEEIFKEAPQKPLISKAKANFIPRSSFSNIASNISPAALRRTSDRMDQKAIFDDFDPGLSKAPSMEKPMSKKKMKSKVEAPPTKMSKSTKMSMPTKMVMPTKVAMKQDEEADYFKPIVYEKEEVLSDLMQKKKVQVKKKGMLEEVRQRKQDKINKKEWDLDVNDEETKMYELIENAFKSGKTAPYARIKLMVVGEGRAGKTSTIRSLLGQAFDPDEASTKGFDVTRVNASNWKEEGNKSYVAEHLQSALKGDKKPKKEASKTPNSSQKTGESTEDDLTVEINREEVKRYGTSVFPQGSENSDKPPLSLTVWDFGGQKVFYTLHHLFLSEFGFYVLVFDTRKLLSKDKAVFDAAVDYLKFWLYSKKLHAPQAPILLVGTHADELSAKDISTVDKILMTTVLGHDVFNEHRNDQYTFFPIDNVTHNGIEVLKTKIETVAMQQEYITDEIPISYLRALELLLEQKKDYIMLKDAEQILAKCGLTFELFNHALEFMNNRGLITHFANPKILSNFVILQPQWLISGITDIIFDETEHKIPKFDEDFNAQFRRFIDERVISETLLRNIWDKKGYDLEVQKFFKSVMKHTSLMCSYKFDSFESYLIPTLFCMEYSHTQLMTHDVEFVRSETEEEFYKGPYFVLDFSGDYDSVVINDSQRTYVRYLPFGIFERLICLCVEHSSTLSESMKPEVKQNSAKLSFGVDVDFELKATKNSKNEDLWIKVITEDGTSFSAARELVKTIYSMLDGLKQDYFSKNGAESSLSVSLLLPSTKQSKQVLAEYQTIMEKRNEGDKIKFRPSKVDRLKVLSSDYDNWFGSKVDDKVTGDYLDDPNNQFQELQKADPNLESLDKVSPKHGLKPGLKFHCFLSYKQSSAIDLVGKLYYMLSNRGYKCWYDQHFEENLNKQAMTEGIISSMAYVLILSKDIFDSSYVVHEITTAITNKKPIIFMHHPSTGEIGYWEFSDYIRTAPEILKPYFQTVESLQLQRRHYLEQAVMNVLDERLQKIIKDN